MNIALNENKQTRDDTLEPAYLKNRLAPSRTSSSPGSGVDQSVINNINSRLINLDNRVDDVSRIANEAKNKVTTLETSQSTQDTKISSLETSQSAQDLKIKSLEDSQIEQDKKIKASEDDIEEIKDILDNLETSTTVVNYILSIIGLNVPADIQQDPDKLAEWLSEQDNEEGIDLGSLSKRIKNIEQNVITNEEIESLFNS